MPVHFFHSFFISSTSSGRYKNRPTITSCVMFTLTLEIQKVGNPPRTRDDCVGESIAHPAQVLQVYHDWVEVARILLEHTFFKKKTAVWLPHFWRGCDLVRLARACWRQDPIKLDKAGSGLWHGCPILVDLTLRFPNPYFIEPLQDPGASRK